MPNNLTETPPGSMPLTKSFGRYSRLHIYPLIYPQSCRDQIEPVQFEIIQDLQSENRESDLEEEAGERHVRGPRVTPLHGFRDYRAADTIAGLQYTF